MPESDAKPSAASRRGRLLRWGIGLFVLIVVGAAAGTWYLYGREGTPPPVGPETTVITTPLTDTGYPDYVAAINAHFSKGVTLENNAAVQLIRALGPGNDLGPVIDGLGMQPPPTDGEYFTPQWKFTEGLTPPPGADAYDPFGFTAACSEPWTRADRPVVADWLEENAAAIERIAAASRRKRYFVPAYRYSGGRGLDADALGIWGEDGFGQALAVRAMNRLAAGRHEAAWQDVLALHRLAHLFGRSASVLTRMGAVNMLAIAYDATMAILSDALLPPDLARQMVRDLGQLPRLEFADALDVTERYTWLDAVTRLARPWDPNRGDNAWLRHADKSAVHFHGVQWGPVFRAYNDIIDRQVAALRLPTYLARKTAMEAADRSLDVDGDPPTHVFGTDGAIEYVVAATVTPGRTFLRFATGVHASQILTQVAAAMAHYRAVHGRRPAALSDLAPGSIKSVPDDPFTGGPLHYKRMPDGYLLYSVADDLTDNGGREHLSPDDPGRDYSVAIGPTATMQAEGK